MVVLYSVASSERGDHLKLQTVKTNILPQEFISYQSTRIARNVDIEIHV